MSGSRAPTNSNLYIPHPPTTLPPYMFISSLLPKLQTQTTNGFRREVIFEVVEFVFLND